MNYRTAESPLETDACPAAVADALLLILREAILSIRIAANADDADYCAMEANHIHNLPNLIRQYSDDRLRRYVVWATHDFAAEYQQYLGRPPVVYTPYWQRLEDYLLRGQAVDSQA